MHFGFGKFSKVSLLLDWLCTMTVEMTFENMYLFIIYMSDMTDELGGNREILKRQIATQWTIKLTLKLTIKLTFENICQFIICMSDMSSELDGNYAAFGKVHTCVAYIVTWHDLAV